MGYTFIQTAQKIKQFFKRVILNLLSTLNKKNRVDIFQPTLPKKQKLQSNIK
jgi:hypothetical protein